MCVSIITSTFTILQKKLRYEVLKKNYFQLNICTHTYYTTNVHESENRL